MSRINVIPPPPHRDIDAACITALPHSIIGNGRQIYMCHFHNDIHSKLSSYHQHQH